ncbi:MAG: ATP synthase F1 subunit delta [Bacteroidales bacterium]|jgi:F-type H+-transporting ATPase subunit delta|nr:ATP synthase F1 subunit delta [Bacteroidales bacterium]
MHIRSDIRYARAFFDMTEKKQISERIYLQMDNVMALSEGMSICSNWLENPSLSKMKKKKIYTVVFGKSVDKEILLFIYLLISLRRENRLSSILDLWTELYRKKYDIVKANVIMATEDSSLVSLIEQKIEQKTSKQVEMDVKFDSGIIGGFILDVDGLVNDHSIAGRIDKMKRELG